LSDLRYVGFKPNLLFFLKPFLTIANTYGGIFSHDVKNKVQTFQLFNVTNFWAKYVFAVACK